MSAFGIALDTLAGEAFRFSCLRQRGDPPGVEEKELLAAIALLEAAGKVDKGYEKATLQTLSDLSMISDGPIKDSVNRIRTMLESLPDGRKT